MSGAKSTAQPAHLGEEVLTRSLLVPPLRAKQTRAEASYGTAPCQGKDPALASTRMPTQWRPGYATGRSDSGQPHLITANRQCPFTLLGAADNRIISHDFSTCKGKHGEEGFKTIQGFKVFSSHFFLEHQAQQTITMDGLRLTRLTVYM